VTGSNQASFALALWRVLSQVEREHETTCDLEVGEGHLINPTNEIKSAYLTCGVKHLQIS
jgi:hypothetical protein